MKDIAIGGAVDGVDLGGVELGEPRRTVLK